MRCFSISAVWPGYKLLKTSTESRLLIVITAGRKARNQRRKGAASARRLCSLCRKLSEVEACHRNEQGTAYVAIFIHSLNQVIEYPRQNHHLPFRESTHCLYCIWFRLNTQHHKGRECAARLTHFNISHTLWADRLLCYLKAFEAEHM